MKQGKLSELILAGDQKETLNQEEKSVTGSVVNSQVILGIKIKNKIFTEKVDPFSNIDSAALTICNKYEVPFILVKNEILSCLKALGGNENSKIINDKNKNGKGVSFEVSSIEKKNLSSHRTQATAVNGIKADKEKKSHKLNKSHNINNTVNSISINRSPKKNTSHFHTEYSTVTAGERLYKLGKSMIEEKDRTITSFKQETLKKTKEECTFTPKINKNSIVLSLKRSYASVDRVPKCFQSSPPKKTASKTVEIDLQQDKNKQKVLKDPTPKELELITKLYNETKLLEKKREELREEIYAGHTFKPEISNKNEPNFSNFVNRLESWSEKKKEKANNILQNSYIDSKSNQSFFSPIISKRSLELGNKKEIWLDLYNEHKTLTSKKEESLKKNEEEFKATHKKSLVSQNSLKISETLEENMVTKIFEVLDFDSDKVISEEDLNNDHLTSKEMEVLKPLIDKIKAEGSIDFEKFKSILQEMTKSYEKKKAMKDWFMNHRCVHSAKCTHNKSNEQQFSFHPAVTESSNKVFAQSSRHSKVFMERNDIFLKRKMTVQLEHSEKIKELGEGTNLLKYRIYVQTKSGKGSSEFRRIHTKTKYSQLCEANEEAKHES